TLLPNLNKVPQSAFRIVQYNSSDDSLGKSAEYVLNSRPRFYSSNNVGNTSSMHTSKFKVVSRKVLKKFTS
ncbi:unnamed protein product, partial [Trichobilharzia regenti]